MTYDDIVDWIDDNIPDDLYDSFNEWMSAVLPEFGGSLPDVVEDQLRDQWEDAHGEFEEEEDFDDSDFFEPPQRKTDYVAPSRVTVTREANTIYIQEPDKPIRTIEIPPDGFKATFRPEPTTREILGEASRRARLARAQRERQRRNN